MARILVTGIGGPAGAAVTTLATRRGHTVIGVDLAPPTFSSATVCAAIPAANDAELLPALRDLVSQHDVDLLIPTVQDELPVIAGARHHLGCQVAVSSADTVALAHDKYLTALALAAAGVPVPATVAVAGPVTDSHAAALRKLGLPFILKPRMSRGGRGVVVVNDLADLATIPSGSIAQTFATGTEYAVQVYARPGHIEVVPLEKTVLKQGLVGNASHVVRRTSNEVPDVASVAAAAAEALGLAGPADMDIRRTVDGTPVVLEVNARFGAHSTQVPEFFDWLLADHLMQVAA